MVVEGTECRRTCVSGYWPANARIVRASRRHSKTTGAFTGGQPLLFRKALFRKQLVWRRGSESNRRIRLLQSPALPLGYPAVTEDQKLNQFASQASLY